METKDTILIGLLVVVLFGGCFGGLAYAVHSRTTCQIAALQANKSATDVIAICGRTS